VKIKFHTEKDKFCALFFLIITIISFLGCSLIVYYHPPDIGFGALFVLCIFGVIFGGIVTYTWFADAVQWAY
jgi:hypothetical protein